MILIPILTVYIMIYTSQAKRHGHSKSKEINHTDSRGTGHDDYENDGTESSNNNNGEEELYEDVKTEPIIGSILMDTKSFSATPMSRQHTYSRYSSASGTMLLGTGLMP
jgi:hypothetical protein